MCAFVLAIEFVTVRLLCSCPTPLSSYFFMGACVRTCRICWYRSTGCTWDPLTLKRIFVLGPRDGNVLQACTRSKGMSRDASVSSTRIGVYCTPFAPVCVIYPLLLFSSVHRLQKYVRFANCAGEFKLH